ncbi:hypothetical protein KM043_001526 [Ampulex compressa]|nr:hypothetical protein KM043_001526 [Ampulex compressa]
MGKETEEGYDRTARGFWRGSRATARSNEETRRIVAFASLRSPREEQVAGEGAWGSRVVDERSYGVFALDCRSFGMEGPQWRGHVTGLPWPRVTGHTYAIRHQSLSLGGGIRPTDVPRTAVNVVAPRKGRKASASPPGSLHIFRVGPNPAAVSMRVPSTSGKHDRSGLVREDGEPSADVTLGSQLVAASSTPCRRARSFTRINTRSARLALYVEKEKRIGVGVHLLGEKSARERGRKEAARSAGKRRDGIVGLSAEGKERGRGTARGKSAERNKWEIEETARREILETSAGGPADLLSSGSNRAACPRG